MDLLLAFFSLFWKRNHIILAFINRSFKLRFWYIQSSVFYKFDQFPKYFLKSHPRVSLRVNKPSYYQSLHLNHSLQLNIAKTARNNESLSYNFSDWQNISINIDNSAKHVITTCAIFSFCLCFLALVIISLFRLEKIFKFKYYHTVLKAVLEGLNFFYLNAV